VAMDANEFVPVIADERVIRQVLLNLLGNAVKFTESGGAVKLRASGRPTADGRQAVTFVVEDTGIGIDPADAERIFEPFVRLDAGRSRDTGGTGLGLAIARSIVLAHRGTLEVKTSAGGGSRFTIDLPAA